MCNAIIVQVTVPLTGPKFPQLSPKSPGHLYLDMQQINKANKELKYRRNANRGRYTESKDVPFTAPDVKMPGMLKWHLITVTLKTDDSRGRNAHSQQEIPS